MPNVSLALAAKWRGQGVRRCLLLLEL